MVLSLLSRQTLVVRKERELDRVLEGHRMGLRWVVQAFRKARRNRLPLVPSQRSRSEDQVAPQRQHLRPPLASGHMG